MSGARAGWLCVFISPLTAFAVSCTTPATGTRSPAASPIAAAPVAPPPATAPLPPVSPARAEAIARLARLNQSQQFLFGEENATLWGMYLDGAVVSTNTWFEKTARAGRFTSDGAAIVGDDPAVLGVSVGMLAFEPPGWNRRSAVAASIKHQIAEGGLVTMDWHAASCTARAPAGEELATVKVGGREVSIHAVAGGTLFYAEEEYTQADHLAGRRAGVAQVPVRARQRPATRRWRRRGRARQDLAHRAGQAHRAGDARRAARRAADHRPSLSRAHWIVVLVGTAVLELCGAARRAGRGLGA